MITPAAYKLRMEIQRTTDAARFPVGPVPEVYLQEARDQTEFYALRKNLGNGHGVQVREVPVLAEGEAEQITGLKLVAGDGGREVELEFGIDLFSPLAQVRALKLATEGHLEKDAKFIFRIFAEPKAAQASGPASGVTATVKRKPLPLVEGRMSDWLKRSEPVGPVQTRDYPLFVTERALELSRTYCRRPVDKEGGALMLGRLFRQLEPEPEIFGVIEDAIEAKYAEEKQFSLDLTTQGFAHLQTQLHIRRTRLGKADELALGFSHSHPFLPSVDEDGKPKCPGCELRPTCNLSSSFYSSRDTEFHRALFARQSYAVGLVWGLSPREEDDLRVYTLDGTSPRQRGYYKVTEGAT